MNTFQVLVSTLVIAVIFWRKSDDWMGILAVLTLVLMGSNGLSCGVLAPVGARS